MTVSAGALRDLHRIHQQLGDLRDRLERGPRQVKARAANVTRLEQELVQVQNDTKAAQVSADNKQLLLKSAEIKIEDLKKKLNAATSNREYQSLKDQIAADQMATSVLADEILEMMEKVDDFKGRIATARENLAKAKAEMDKAELAVRDQHEMLLSEVRRLEEELQVAERALPPDFRDPYNRVVKSKGSDAMAAVEGDTCGGCHSTLTPNQHNSLHMNKVIFCPSCGRLLYLPEDRSPGGGVAR